jgi:hypothetical protein
MIRFNEALERTGTAEIPASPPLEFTNSSDLTADEARSLLDELFAGDPENETNEVSYECEWDEIYGRNSNEFVFDFPFDDEVTKALTRFDEGEWSQLTTSERLEAMRAFVELLAAKLGLEKVPEIVLFDGPEYLLGTFVEGKGEVEINQALLEDPKALVNTLAHEMRHAYQYEHAMNPQCWTDVLYRINFDNYVTPEMSFEDYQDQLVEAEARAFAKLFAPKEAE